MSRWTWWIAGIAGLAVVASPGPGQTWLWEKVAIAATKPLAWGGIDQLICSGIYASAQYCSLTNQDGGRGYCAPYGTGGGQSTTCAGGVPGVSQAQQGDQCYSIFGGTYGLYNAMWTPLPVYDGHADNGDRDGIVVGGFPDGRNWTCDAPGTDHCREPHLSKTDNCGVHEDRDLNIPFLPMLGYDRQFLDWTFVAQDNINAFDGPPAGVVGLEIEWRYFFPTLWSWQFPGNGQTPDDVPVRLDMMPAACGIYSNSGDCAIPLGIPQSGDEMTVRGRPIFDCAHQVFGLGHTEYHPIRGLIWLHPTPDNPSDGMIWLRLLSHEGAPLQDGCAGTYSGCTPKHGGGCAACEPQVGFGGPMIATFDIPGYPSPTGEDLYIGTVKTDWVGDPNHGMEKANTYGGTGTDCSNPWARWVVNGSASATAADMSHHQATDVFTIAAAQNNGYVTVTASLNPSRPNGEADPVPSDLPFIAGAHLRVCYPTCDSNGCQTNDCPGFCKSAAKCVTKYTTGVTVDNTLTSTSWSGWTGNEEADGLVVGPHMSSNELPTTLAEFDVWNSNDSFVPWGPYYLNYTGMIYSQRGNTGQWVIDLAGGNNNIDTHVNIFSDGTPSAVQSNRVWRYNGLTGQITTGPSGWLCLDTLNSDGTTATGVQVERCDKNRATQKWLWSSSSGTSGTFIHIIDQPNGSVSCLSVPSLANSTQLNVGNCYDTNSQWTFYYDPNAGLN